MYAYDLIDYTDRKTPSDIAAFIDRLRDTQTKEGSRAAVLLMLKEVGVYPIETYNEAYYAEQLRFEIGMLMAHGGLYKEASDALGFVESGPGGDFVFAEHVRQSLEFHRQQTEAIQRGMILPLITSLPKSGSASLTQTLAKNLNVPLVRISAGHFPDYALVRHWLNHWQHGGMINHGHFGATPHNLEMLRAENIQRLVVQVRDPRAATWSYLKMRRNQRQKDGLTLQLEEFFPTHYLDCVRWLQGWLAVSAQPGVPVIEWVTFAQFKAEPAKVYLRLLEPLQSTRGMLKIVKQLRKGKLVEVKANFTVGDDDAWRAHASPALQKRMWEALPSDVISLLGLTP